MKMKKLLAGLLVGTMALSLLTACGKKDEAGQEKDAAQASGKQVVNLWATGSDNVRSMYEVLIQDFNTNSDYKDQYEVKLNFLLSGTGTQSLTDMLAAANKAGQKDTDYDLVDLNGDDLSKMDALIGAEGFLKIDKSKVPNAANVSATSSILPEHSQPFRGTSVVLAYDSEKVPEPPKTMDELVAWAKANPGRFAYNAPGTGGAGDSFARSAVYNFLPKEAFTSNDEAWAEQWDEGFNFLKEFNNYVYKSGGAHVYPNKNQGALDLLNQGEVDMVPMWADMVLSQRKDGAIRDSIKITQISPSFTGSLQVLTIPAFGSHPDGAYAFIDYMLTKNAQQMLVSQMAAIPLIDAAELDMAGVEDLGGLNTSDFRIQSIGELSKAFNERWDNEIATLG